MKEVGKDVYEHLSKSLERVNLLEGVHAPHYPDAPLGFMAGHSDDYQIPLYLGQLIERGELKIMIAPEREAYLKELLRLK